MSTLDRQDATRVILSMVVSVLLIDVGINVILTDSPEVSEGLRGRLARYFGYGRSIESKLDRLIGPTDETSAEIATIGWLDSDDTSTRSALALPAKAMVSMYGMSFVRRIGQALEEIDPSITTRFIGGPGAPANHCYDAFLRDRNNHQAPVVVMGITANGVSNTMTLTGATWAFEFPFPYTYPLFRVVNGDLDRVDPIIETIDDFRRARKDRKSWTRWVQQLAENDSYYDPFLFRKSIFDSSATVRVIRRAWAQRRDQLALQKLVTAKGFVPNSPELQSIAAICEKFTGIARADGRFPIIILVNNRGFSDYLYQALSDFFKKTDIPYISTHNLAPATDPSNFIADGHFIEAADRAIAEELRGRILPYLSSEPAIE